ncbi:MAG: hypothetical protein IJL01_00250, partial [Synergistaceae bacterium]|nr:hypothetical protein [Synergistaceae bacterium]
MTSKLRDLLSGENKQRTGKMSPVPKHNPARTPTHKRIRNESTQPALPHCYACSVVMLAVLLC